MTCHHIGFGYKRLSDSKAGYHPLKLTLTEMFNLGRDIDIEHSNPILLLDTFFADYDLESSD